MAQSRDWLLAGRGLDLEAFAMHLWSTSPVQSSVIRRDTDEVIGFVRGDRWDLRSRTIEVVLGVAPSHWKLVWPLEGVVIFCDYLLRGLGMRKLYFELRPASVQALGSWVERRCVREWVKVGEVLSPEGELEDVEVWSLSELNQDRVDRLLGRASSGPA